MLIQFNFNEILYETDTQAPIDLSLPVRRDGKGVNCFYTDRPVIEPFKAGSFTGSVNMGGSCNVDVIRFTPHGNGTHTECLGHITGGGRLITETLKNCLLPCSLITVKPVQNENDRIITRTLLESSAIHPHVEAIVIRTLPNTAEKRDWDYSGTNPPYFEAEALAYIREMGIVHLLCDIPSVDREEDGGKLLAHKAYFGIPDAPQMQATITELIYADASVPDGLYLLNLQTASFQSDASPSRPFLYTLTKR